jgi:hypothetical protein
VVFNAVAGAAISDTAAILVTSTSRETLSDLTAVIHTGEGMPRNWLAVALDRDAVPATLTVRATSAPLPPGEYSAVVRLAAPGAAADSLVVTARVVTGASIGLSAAKICFGTELSGGPRQNEYVWVTSVDGSVIDGLTSTIVYDAGQPGGWLNAPLDATTAPARLRLLPSVGTLPVGTYTATVQVASPKAGNSPVPLRVTLTVKELHTAKLTLTLVTVGQGGAGNGRLTAPGIDCVLSNGTQSGDCEEAYVLGTVVHVIAAPAPAQVFYYTQGCRYPGPCGETGFDMTMSEDMQFEGGFGAPASRLLVTTTWEGADNGGLAFVEGPHGLRCENGGCSGLLDGGVGDYPIVAYGEYGARFVRWEGACSGSAGLCTLRFDTPGTTQEVTAVFGTMPSIISNMMLQGGGASGTVTFSAPVTVPGGGPLTCRIVDGVQAARCEGELKAGVGTFTVTATPDPGSIFVRWVVGGLPGVGESAIGCVETAPSCTFTFTRGGGLFDGVVTFASTSSYSLQVEIQGTGHVSWPYSSERYTTDCPSSCREYFAPGSTVTLTAHSGEGATFSGWTDCSVPSGSKCDMAMSENRHVVARFGP